jgi:hypothetical protein
MSVSASLSARYKHNNERGVVGGSVGDGGVDFVVVVRAQGGAATEHIKSPIRLRIDDSQDSQTYMETFIQKNDPHATFTRTHSQTHVVVFDHDIQ